MIARRRGRAYTLVELMVVVTLLAIMVGISTIGLQDVTDDSLLRSAADRIGAVYRLAIAQAARTGRPHVLEFTTRSLTLRRPTMRDGRWEWTECGDFDLPAKVRIKNVAYGSNSALSDRQDSPWRFPIAAGAFTGELHIGLETRSGSQAAVTISNAGRSVAIESPGDDRN